jgi:hypothetical protein
MKSNDRGTGKRKPSPKTHKNPTEPPIPKELPASFPSRRPESQPANPEVAAGQSSGAARPANSKAADLAVYKEDGAARS